MLVSLVDVTFANHVFISEVIFLPFSQSTPFWNITNEDTFLQNITKKVDNVRLL